MTEQEMMTKPCIGPCPTITGRVVRGGKIDGSDAYLCNGSACLAWRELDYIDAATKRQFSDKTGHEIARMNLVVGFCGLAGKP